MFLELFIHLSDLGTWQHTFLAEQQILLKIVQSVVLKNSIVLFCGFSKFYYIELLKNYVKMRLCWRKPLIDYQISLIKKNRKDWIDILIFHPEEVSIESFSLERQRYVLKLSIGWITNRTRCVATSSPPKIVGCKRKDFNSTVCCSLSVIEVNYLHLHNTSVFTSGVYIEQRIIKVL